MRRVGLPLLAAVVALTAACSRTLTIEQPRPPAVLGPVVDSIVALPFEKASPVVLNEADLALFNKHLREHLGLRERLRTFDDPPTRLPNTVVLAGRVERVAVDERSEDALVLRTIELEAELKVLPADGGEARNVLRRAVAWQKLYPGSPVSALPLDLEDAVRELTGQFADALAPLPDLGPVVLGDGRDPDTGEGLRHPELVQGNRDAASGDYARAKLTWMRVLFDPEPAASEPTYRISPYALGKLRAAGVGDALLERLQPLTEVGPVPLVDFRGRLRATLGEVVAQEGLILTTANAQAAVTHRVLATAHENLAALYALEGRYELVAYHWSRAWGYNPKPALLERWRALQAERNVLPRTVSVQEAMELYLRIPPPSTAQVLPGPFERTVVPRPAFADVAAAEGAAAPAADRGGGAGGGSPPVAPPPAAPDDSTPGRAAGSGPSRAPGAPNPVAPAPGTAPSSQ